MGRQLIFLRCALTKISKLEFFNSPKSGKELVFELDAAKQFFVLTGYNGAGKSRIIKIILEAFSTLRSTKYKSEVSRWAFQCTMDDAVRVRALKMEQGAATKEEIGDLFQNFFEKDWPLNKVFEEAGKLVNKETYAKIAKLSDDEEVEEGFCGSGALVPGGSASGISPDDYAQQIGMVAYIDETIHRSFPVKPMSGVIEGDGAVGDIDRTLASLIHEFVVKQAATDVVKDRISSLLTKKNGQWKANLSKDKIRAAVEAAVRELGNNTNFEDNEVFEVLNSFYRMTNRQIVWRDDSIYMDVPNEGVIHFVGFSKGEKTLLVLMLSVYLYRDRMFFLLDEPDLSLHVEWQKKLLPAFARLAPNAQFIIGTHSPFLVMRTQSEQVVNLAKVYKDRGI